MVGYAGAGYTLSETGENFQVAFRVQAIMLMCFSAAIALIPALHINSAKAEELAVGGRQVQQTDKLKKHVETRRASRLSLLDADSSRASFATCVEDKRSSSSGSQQSSTRKSFALARKSRMSLVA